MATMKKGVLAAAGESEVEEPGEAAEGETAQQESAEEANPALEAGEPGESAEAPEPGEGGAQAGVDPKLMELSSLVVARVRDALAAAGEDLKTTLKADPVQGAVEIGTRAVREVAMGAEKAGRALPFEAILVAGMQVIKDMAEIAVELGYLPEDQIETFLKEVFQQSVRAYAKLDMDAGLIDQQSLAAVQQKMGGATGAPQPGGGALAQAAGPMQGA